MSLLGGAGQVEVGDGGAADAAVAVAVGLVDVDGGHVGVQGRQGGEAFAGERAGDDAGGAVAEGVGAEQRPGRQERHAHRRGLEAHGQGVVGPLGAGDLARLHHAPGVRRQAARFQADDVGDVHRGQRLAAAGAGCRRRAAGNRAWRCGRRSAGPACPGGGSRERRRWECGRSRSRRWPGNRRRGPGGATASATVVSLSMQARGLVAKNARAWSAEGSANRSPSPRERVSMSSEAVVRVRRVVEAASRRSVPGPRAPRRLGPDRSSVQRFSNSRSSWRKRGSWRIESRSWSSRM